MGVRLGERGGRGGGLIFERSSDDGGETLERSGGANTFERSGGEGGTAGEDLRRLTLGQMLANKGSSSSCMSQRRYKARDEDLEMYGPGTMNSSMSSFASSSSSSSSSDMVR